MTADETGWVRCADALPTVGDQVQLKFRDRFGSYSDDRACFLNDDGNWFVIEPPTLIVVPPYCWRPI